MQGIYNVFHYRITLRWELYVVRTCSHEMLRRDRNVYYIWGWQNYVPVCSSYNLRMIQHLSYEYLYLNSVGCDSLFTDITPNRTSQLSAILHVMTHSFPSAIMMDLPDPTHHAFLDHNHESQHMTCATCKQPKYVWPTSYFGPLLPPPPQNPNPWIIL